MCRTYPNLEMHMKNKPTSCFLNELKQLIPAITCKWGNMHISTHMTHMLNYGQAPGPAIYLQHFFLIMFPRIISDL